MRLTNGQPVTILRAQAALDKYMKNDRNIFTSQKWDISILAQNVMA